MSETPPSQPEANTGTPLGAMSIAKLIPRFTQPRILTRNIPTYRHSFSLPIEGNEEESSSSDAAGKQREKDTPAEANSKEPQTQPSSASFVEWYRLLPVPSNLLGSFRDLFEARHNATVARSDDSATQQQEGNDSLPPTSASPPPRLVFFGEQHHQPEVMRAQLQTLHSLHEQCVLASNPSIESKSPPIYRVHLILEHFSVLDQPMLTSFSKDKLGPDELADAYRSQSEESFKIGHYMPLLMLAKELQVPIWGGFPPRDWARQVFRNGVDSIKAQEAQRVNGREADETLPSVSASTSEDEQQTSKQRQTPELVLTSPLFTSWSAVTKIGAAHRSYLSGLFRPDLPPRFPELPSEPAASGEPPIRSGAPLDTHSSVYPTWLLKPHNIETKGFGPAQALKDSYLAHVTAWILRGARLEASLADKQQKQLTTSPDASAPVDSPVSQSREATATANDSDRPIINVALVVCGLGHAEYGFGAPERVVQLLSQQGTSSDHDLATLLPYIIASKPLDSGIWLGYEYQSQDTEPSDVATEASRPASEAKQVEMPSPVNNSTAAVQRWLNDPWGRRMADAVLLYDWIDDEPKDEASANADGHEPVSA